MFKSKFNKMYRSVISQMNDEIMKQVGFGDAFTLKNNGQCPHCKAKVDPSSFKDEVSKREYKISGLCQKCQDEIFADDNEEEGPYQYAPYYEASEDIRTPEQEMPDDLKAYLNKGEEPEDFRNDDIKSDKQDQELPDQDALSQKDLQAAEKESQLPDNLFDKKYESLKSKNSEDDDENFDDDDDEYHFNQEEEDRGEDGSAWNYLRDSDDEEDDYNGYQDSDYQDFQDEDEDLCDLQQEDDLQDEEDDLQDEDEDLCDLQQEDDLQDEDEDLCDLQDEEDDFQDEDEDLCDLQQEDDLQDEDEDLCDLQQEDDLQDEEDNLQQEDDFQDEQAMDTDDQFKRDLALESKKTKKPVKSKK